VRPKYKRIEFSQALKSGVMNFSSSTLIEVGGLHGEAEGIRIGKRIGHAQ